MAEKTKKKIYYPTELESEAYMLCIRNNIAFSLKRVSINEDLYYIEKYDIRYPKKTTFLRKDLSMPHSFSNRLQLTEYEAWKKIFEFYKMQSDILNKTKIEVERESQEAKEVSPRLNDNRRAGRTSLVSGLSTQIDLLDMIREVEEENKSLDK